MNNNMTIEQEVNREVLLYAVQRKIFCDISGKILDIDTAVLFLGTKDGENAVNIIMDGAVWDENGAASIEKAEALGIVPEIIDGRELV